jgi:CelD/BcsL family acetyltransferase involved in cellulose biosynthesis
MATLRAGGRPVAGRFGIEADGVYNPWIAAYDPALSAFGPGHLLLSAIIAAADTIPLSVYHLGPGLEAVKRPRANLESLVLSGEAQAAGRREAAPAPARLLRLRRRLDQIALVELDLSGRAFGVADALAKAPRRWSAG